MNLRDLSIHRYCDIGNLCSVEKGERTRRALLAAAVRRFAADGYQRTSVTDVARDVGVTPAAVYAYFPSKEALFAAAVNADAEELVALAANVLIDYLDHDSLPHVITQLAEEVLGAVDSHPLARNVLAGREELPAPELLDLPSLVNLREALAGGIEYGQAIGQVRTSIDPKVMALGLESIVLSQLAISVQEGYSAERWHAVVAVMQAALEPPSDTTADTKQPPQGGGAS